MSPRPSREGSGRRLVAGVRPTKSRGQNFLVDRRVAARIVDAAGVEGAVVLEIGPGAGALSGLLAARARRLVLVEIDAVLAAGLRERFAGAAHVEILEADALRVDLDVLDLGERRAIVVSNLPYSVGSQIFVRLLDEHRRFARLVLMLQREVAERLVAAPGTREYGPLAVWTTLRSDARLLFRVAPGAFVPRPRVESAVVRLDLLAAPRVEVRDEARLRTVVRAAFGQRRKTLRRALANRVAPGAFERAGIDAGRRGETLTLAEFARLAEES